MLGGGASSDLGAAGEIAAALGLDAALLRIQVPSRSVTLAGRGTVSAMAQAAEALRSRGVNCAAVQEIGAATLPRLELAGGVAPEGAGAVLRVHGRPAGPPAGVPLLLVFGDLGREGGLPPPSAPRPSDSIRQRLLRAVFPAVDVVWTEGRVRVPLRGMTWRGLPGLTASAPLNFLRLLEILVERSAGAVLDLGFRGQDMAVDSGPPSGETPEGCDRETAAVFDRYTAAAALAWGHGLYPNPVPGLLVVPAEGEEARAPAEVFRARPAAPPRSPVPWIRRGRASRVRGTLWPWLMPGAVALLFFRATSGSIAILALSGLAAIAFGLRWLRTRERVRALTLARVRSAAMGPVQLAGTVVPCAAIVTPYSRVRAGWYRLEIQERRGDSERHGWSAVQEGGSGDIPFRLQDETGSILVQPAGAEVDVPPVTTELSADLRAVEWVIAEGAPLFVAGFAQRREGGADSEADGLFVGSRPGTSFLISHRSREKETAALTRKFRALVALGLFYLVLALVLGVVRSAAGV